MTPRTATHPFRFAGCVELRQTLDVHALDERELMRRIAEVPPGSSFFRTVGYFLRHRAFTTAYGNDFARWAAHEIGDHALAERLAVVDPFAFSTVEELREHLVTIVQDHLRGREAETRVEFDRAFHFQQSHIVEVPLGLSAETLVEFRAGLATVDESAIYLHTVETRARERRSEAFSEWLRDSLDLPALAERFERADPYLTSLARWVDMNGLNAKKLDLDADLTVVHDCQPASLVSARTAGRWVWRCHFDCSSAQPTPWTFFRRFAEQYDAAVFALPGFEGRLGIPMYIVPPSIDPLSERNRDLTPRETSATLTALGVSPVKPLLVQIGRFARAHDPLGVVNAYRLVKKHHDVRLVLAGTADGEPERLELLSHLLEVAHDDHDVGVLELPPEEHRHDNALQRTATIVLMKSVRAGFDLGPAEAMWKGKPEIGRAHV